MMTPTKTILAGVAARPEITDATGRRLRVRPPTALDTLRLLKAAGPTLAENQAWLSMAALAVAVTEIDGIPVVTPVSEAQIEALVDRLGDVGLEAVAAALDDPSSQRGSDDAAIVGNSHGTLT
jgi:hypothetical protein